MKKVQNFPLFRAFYRLCGDSLLLTKIPLWDIIQLSFFEISSQKKRRFNFLWVVFLELHQNRTAFLTYFMEQTIIHIWVPDAPDSLSMM